MSKVEFPYPNGMWSVFAEIASGYIHEINNKLGPILIDAEVLAMSGCGASETVADIARNALVLRDLVRDLESMLPMNFDQDLSATERMRHVERLARGAMRRRHLRMDVVDTSPLPPVAKDHCEARLALLLASLAFRGPDEGEMGVVKVTCFDDEEARKWRFDVEPRVLPDAGIASMLSEVCRRNEWNMEAKAGTVAVVFPKGDNNVE